MFYINKNKGVFVITFIATCIMTVKMSSVPYMSAWTCQPKDEKYEIVVYSNDIEKNKLKMNTVYVFPTVSDGKGHVYFEDEKKTKGVIFK